MNAFESLLTAFVSLVIAFKSLLIAFISLSIAFKSLLTAFISLLMTFKSHLTAFVSHLNALTSPWTAFIGRLEASQGCAIAFEPLLARPERCSTTIVSPMVALGCLATALARHSRDSERPASASAADMNPSSGDLPDLATRADAPDSRVLAPASSANAVASIDKRVG